MEFVSEPGHAPRPRGQPDVVVVGRVLYAGVARVIWVGLKPETRMVGRWAGERDPSPSAITWMGEEELRATAGVETLPHDISEFYRGICGLVDRYDASVERRKRLDTALDERTHIASEEETTPMTSKEEKSVIDIPDPWKLHDMVLGARVSRMLVYGPPGIGKSYTSARWATRKGWRFLSVTLTDQTPMSEMRGHFVLKGSEFVWHDGVVARAWRSTQSGEDVLLQLNEINEAGQDTETFLHNALDDPDIARLDLPNGELLKPAPGKLMIVATMNGEPEHLREALRDRFPVRIAVNEPHPDAIAALPADLQGVAKTMCTMDAPELRTSIRPWAEYAVLRTRIPPFAALVAVFGKARAADLAVAMNLAAAPGGK
jgi:hypothetical protein